jgi:iron complex outermembrane recepter protein
MKKPLLAAARAAALTGFVTLLGAGNAFAQPAATPGRPATGTSATTPGATAAQPTTLERFEVTGSRIRRLDIETPQPVLVLSAADLDTTGFSTVGDAMRSLPFNTGQSLTPVSSGTSFTPGIHTFNLRGLGSNNVLVLVNGRRTAPFGASGFNGFQTMFDLNSLPTSAIESIELLKDGGSAIYGSDAVSGVVNVKLRKDYSGGSLTLSVGNTVETDSFERSAYFLFGTSTPRTQILTTVDWYQREAIFARDLKFSRNTDLRDVGGINRSSSAGFPGMVSVPGVGNRTFLAPTTTPRVADAVPLGTANGDVGAGLYNFLLDSDMFPNQRQSGFYTRVSHDLTDRMRTYAELSFRRAETRSHAAATPMFGFNEQGYRYDLLTAEQLGGVTPDPRNRAHYGPGLIDMSNVGIMIPAYNPFNPWGVPLMTDNRVRFVPAGPRINDVQSDTPRYVLGLAGEWDVLTRQWTWDTAVNYTKSTFVNTNPGAHQDRKVQDAFHGVTFNRGTPEEATLFLNPFGPSDPLIYEYIGVRNPVTSSFQVRGFDINAAGELFDLPAGPLGLAVGGAFNDEKLNDVRTALNEQGQIVGGSEGSSIFGARNVYSAYAEVSVPVIPTVEMQLAARYEDYSDFGTTTKPKVSAKWRPHRSFIIRGSYGESFLAPNLPYLYASQSTSFTAAALIDPRRPNDQATQIKQLGGGNPNLDAEETKTYYFGAVFEPTFEALRGWTFAADYFIFDSENLITRFDAQDILAGENRGDPAFAALVTRNPPATGQTVGTIQAVRTAWTNAAVRKYKGADFSIGYSLNTRDLGSFRFLAAATYLEKMRIGASEFAGQRLFPRVRGNFTASWQRRDWGASVFVNHIDSRSGTGQMSGTARVINARYGSQTIVNPQVSYRGLFNSKITLGARNIFDREPPLDYGEAERWTPGVNHAEPLFWYLRVSRDF